MQAIDDWAGTSQNVSISIARTYAGRGRGWRRALFNGSIAVSGRTVPAKHAYALTGVTTIA